MEVLVVKQPQRGKGMLIYQKKLFGILTVLMLCTPMVVFSQDGRRWDRGDIQVNNDWERVVRVTLWNERGGQMSRRTWTILPGQSALLADERGQSLRVGGNDKIKVGDDWGQVDIGTVGHRQGRVWYVSVREVWRATP